MLATIHMERAYVKCMEHHAPTRLGHLMPESEATNTIRGQEITQTNALIGIGVVGALSFLMAI
jgi:hypothetical protein